MGDVSLADVETLGRVGGELDAGTVPLERLPLLEIGAVRLELLSG